MEGVIHQCFKICDCDMDGEPVCGLDDGRIIKEKDMNAELENQVRWSSVTCSKCNQVAYFKDGGY